VSIVARVFVVLNLILSIVFLVFAFEIWTARTKWHKMYEGERLANIRLKENYQNIEVDLLKSNVQKEEVLKARKQSIADLKVQVNELRDRLLQVQGEVGEAKASAQMQMALNEELQREINRRSEQLDKAKNVIVKQQQALVVARQNETEARNLKAEMENELNALRGQYAQILRDKRQIEQDLAEQTQRIQNALNNNVPAELILGQDPDAKTPALPPARVLAVRPDLDLIMLSIGSNQGVKPGYRMTVSRGDQYLAKAEVLRVYPDMCSARLLLKKGEVQVNDEANSRIPGIGSK
jgi:hypothetical protein